MFLEEEDRPVIWRGPMLSGIITKIWEETVWGDLDYLLIDMPPGTGDIILTIYQSIPIDGLIIVTTPQALVNLIVKKSYNMAKEMNIDILGIVENMSYLICENCNKKIQVFGDSQINSIAKELGLNIIERIPIDNNLVKMIDKGEIEDYKNNLFKENKYFI